MTKDMRLFKHFCQATILDTPEVYVFCGVGYRNHSRKNNKNTALCEAHLKGALSHERQLLRKIQMHPSDQVLKDALHQTRMDLVKVMARNRI